MATVDEEVYQLIQAAAAGAADAVRARVQAAGFGDVRPAHQAVFRHLEGGPVRISDLASLLDITPQGASKVVVELEKMGYAARSVAGDDQRNRLAQLTPRGRAAVAAIHQGRAEVASELRARLGKKDTKGLADALRRVAKSTGGFEAAAGRHHRTA